MKHVKYTPLLREYLENLVLMAQHMKQEEDWKPREQLDMEADFLISHLETIKFINNYDEGTPTAGAWKWFRDMLSIKKLFPQN